MSDDDQKPPIERAVELVVYAPIGLALFARDMLPPLLEQFVARGKARVEELQHQVENQLGQARIVGQFAVAQGTEQVKREVGKLRRDVSEQEPGRPPSRVEAAVRPAAATTGNGSTAPRTAPRTPPPDLPIPDYDELSASQVVARLAGLDGDELRAVRSYEEGQRQRKTILTRIEQLTS